MNAAGGLSIGGKEKRPIEFVKDDDQSAAAQARNYEKLISVDKVDLRRRRGERPLTSPSRPSSSVTGSHWLGATASTTLVGELGAKYMWFTEMQADFFGGDLPKLYGGRRQTDRHHHQSTAARPL